MIQHVFLLDSVSHLERIEVSAVTIVKDVLKE